MEDDGVELATIYVANGGMSLGGRFDITMEFADWFGVLPADVRVEVLQAISKDAEFGAKIERGRADPEAARAALKERDDMGGMASPETD